MCRGEDHEYLQRDVTWETKETDLAVTAAGTRVSGIVQRTVCCFLFRVLAHTC